MHTIPPSLPSSFPFSLPLPLSQFPSPLLLYCRLPLSLLSSKRGGDGSSSQSRLSVNSLDFSDPDQLSLLKDMGILVHALAGGRVQISHAMQTVITIHCVRGKLAFLLAASMLTCSSVLNLLK